MIGRVMSQKAHAPRTGAGAGEFRRETSGWSRDQFLPSLLLLLFSPSRSSGGTQLPPIRICREREQRRRSMLIVDLYVCVDRSLINFSGKNVIEFGNSYEVYRYRYSRRVLELRFLTVAKSVDISPDVSLLQLPRAISSSI